MKQSTKYVLALALAGIMLVSGCSGNSRSSERTESGSNDSQRAVLTSTAIPPMEDAEGFYNEAAGEDMSYSVNLNASTSSGAMAGGEAATPDSPVVTAPESAASDRMLIRRVTLSCETLRFAELTSGVEAQVSALGGYIENKNISGTGNNNDLRTATYVIRVSSDALDSLINTIGNTAIITNTNESTEDVTLTYADTEARLESLRVEQETLNNLLAEADDLDIILQLQNELTYVRYEIESCESQLRLLENYSTFSTLTLTVTEVLEETEPEEPHIKTYSEKISESFHDGLDKVKTTFQDLGLYLAEHLVPLAVLLVIAIAVIIIVTKKVKKYKKNKTAKTAAKKEENKPSTKENEEK
ncbi:MAG: DUF4349 domain-containing protein [Clostridiales bacterium]|nr:DUF4349 domain-containing protein [Clostridiales bacterium]